MSITLSACRESGQVLADPASGFAISFEKIADLLVDPGLLLAVAEVTMSVVTRIRIVGTITTAIASALGVFAMFWLVSLLDVLPGVQSGWLASALLMGLPLLTTLCLLLALSIDASQRGVQWPRVLELTLGDPGTFEAPSLEVGRV